MTVLGVDGGNTKTDVLLASLDGEPLAYVRGPGSNSHALGSDGCIAVVASLVERAGLDEPAAAAAIFLCGADVPRDIEELSDEVSKRAWAPRAMVDNDTFALLRTGTSAADAVAVICGSGINCVGRAAGGRTARYPSLGRETGDWGGGETFAREVLFLAARAEDGRGDPTALVDAVRAHFGLPTVAAVGEAVHYRRGPAERLAGLAPAAIAAAADGDAVATQLVDRLADEIALMVRRAFRDLELDERTADVVLGGGMLRGGGFLVERVLLRLPRNARPVVVAEPPVVGAALAALDEAGASPEAEARLREAVRTLEPEVVHGASR